MNKKRNQYQVNLSIVLLGVFLIVQCGTPDQRHAALSAEGFIQSNDDFELYYQIRGAGPDTLIMLHGGPGLNFDYLAPDLGQMEEHFTLIYYDQRGAGRSTLISDPDLLIVEAHVTDLEAVRQHFNIDKATLFGHSWGAMLASFYVLEHSDKVAKMVFSSPGPPRFYPYLSQLRSSIMAWMDDTKRDEIDRLMAARQDSTVSARKSCIDFWEPFIRGYFSDPHDLDLIRSMRGDFCAGPEEALRNGAVVGTHTFASIDDFDLRDRLQHIDLPVLLITGTDDIFPEESMYEWETAYPNSKLVLLDKAGHYPQIERPEVFFQVVRDFLRDSPE
jgi:proline iminopeptidase